VNGSVSVSPGRASGASTHRRCSAAKLRTHKIGGHLVKERDLRVTLGQGKTFCEEVLLTADPITPGYSVTAATAVDLLVLQKTDYDKFVKDLRVAERREIFMLLRDNWLCAGWTRNKLERLTHLCRKKMFDDGVYLFRQGDPPDVLYLMVSGRVDLVKEIDFVCKNVLPVGLHERVDRTRLQANSVRLKRVTEKGMYFGEVSIIKDTTRSTSAVAVGRTVVLGIDKEVSLKRPRT
jgi:hypothetical protein